MKKIVVIGPESTGKSTLCRQLAVHYQTQWCPEYAREYLTNYGPKYTYDDLLYIAKGQLTLENSKIKIQDSKNKQTIDPPSPLFIDTDMYVMKVWCEYVFGKCHPFILGAIAASRYNLYLLCNIDLPWIKDDLREYPDEKPRRELYSMYKDILINQSTPWVEINGEYNQRLETAIEAIETIL